MACAKMATDSEQAIELPGRKSLVPEVSKRPPPTGKHMRKGGGLRPPPFAVGAAVGGSHLDPNNRRVPARTLYCVTKRPIWKSNRQAGLTRPSTHIDSKSVDNYTTSIEFLSKLTRAILFRDDFE